MKAIRKDFFMEIIKTKSRFLSIFAIVALGVAFYAGIRSAEPDMRLSADTMYDNQKMFDIRVLSTMGLTEDDVADIARLPGIETAVGERSTDVLCQSGDSQDVVHLMEQTTGINEVELVQGRYPEKYTECLVDEIYYIQRGLHFGDTLTFSSGDDSDIKDTLREQAFIVVGSFVSASYLSADRGTSTIGNGNVAGLAIVPGDAFVTEIYSTVYASVEGARELNSYSDQYEARVEELTERIEQQVMDAARERRYQEVKEEYGEQIADGERELADALQTLNEGEKEYQDGYDAYADGRQAIDEAKKELADAREQIDQGRQELEQAKQTLGSSQTEIEQSDITISLNEQTLLQQELELENAEAEFDRKKAEYDVAYEQYRDGKTQLEQVRITLDEGWNTYNDNVNNVAALRRLLEEAKTSLAEMNAFLEQNAGEQGTPLYEAIKASLESTQKQIDDYETRIADAETELENGRLELEKGETAYRENKQLLDDTTAQMADAKAQLNDAKMQLDDARQQLNDAKIQLSEGKSQLLAGRQEWLDGNNTIAETETLLAQSEAEYENGMKEIVSREADLAEAELTLKDSREELDCGWEEYEDASAKLADAKTALDELEWPEWYVFDRNYTQSYVEYSNDAERIGKIGMVFPIIFFLVAALVSLTTMTRMVEEQRTQIGTLKSLGYSNRVIAGKYILYAFLASCGGSLVGGVIGCKTLPPIVMSAYGLLYQGLNVQLSPINLYYYLTASAIAAGCILIATFAACYKELLASPAALMRPAAPKRGKRTLLERIPILWEHLSFSKKSTVRNLLRYKKRLFMTMFGICGCMALMITGFGIKGSIQRIVQIQFGELHQYQASITVDSEDEEALAQVYDSIEQEKNVKEYVPWYQTSMEIEKEGTSVDGYLVVSESAEELEAYTVLRDRVSGKPVKLNNTGVVLTEKASSLLDAGVGDTIELKVSDTERYTVTVVGLAENYVYHYVYMTQTLYQQLFGEEVRYNQILLHTEEMSAEQVDDFSERYLAFPAVGGVNFLHDSEDYFADMLGSLDAVIVVLVIAAGLLAFVVLYNLNNINITERKRELASLKVLGFYDGEVSMYVFRENLVITVASLFVGSIMGLWLHRFVILTVEMDIIMFSRTIDGSSFIYSALLTLLFTGIINISMHFKLKKVDMATSLKSVE